MYSSTTTTKSRKVYDFRSDTVTVPTEEMLQAMIHAEVGDDVKIEDPTVKALQEKVAKLCGKEDALFVPSGVMSNQLAIRTHVTMNHWRETIAQSIILDKRSHVFKYELGGLSFHSRIQAIPLLPADDDNFLDSQLIKKNIFQVNDFHTPVTTIISLENTLNGKIFPLEEIQKIREVALEHKMVMHLDGARLWNASIESGISLAEYGKYFESISLCLSKGLGAPVGSVLVGTKEFIAKARQYRKLFGGGMRQAGVLAMCGIYAIDNHWGLMKKDHENAKILHKGLIELGFEAKVPQTNMVWANSTKLGVRFEDITQKLNDLQKTTQENEFKVLIEGEGFSARLVVHFQISLEGIQLLLKLLGTAIQK